MKKKIFLLSILFLFITSMAIPVYASDKATDYAITLKERGISPLLITGLISMLPIFELRGGIPVGIAILKQNPFFVYPVAVIFNLIPVFPVLLFLNPLKKLLEKLPLFKGLFIFLIRKAEKNKRLVEKYEEFGLMLFVAIPLPITGAWTGSLIAVIMGLRVVKSFLFISFGVLLAGIIVTLLTMLGVIGIILAITLLLSFVVVYTVKFMQERKRSTET